MLSLEALSDPNIFFDVFTIHICYRMPEEVTVADIHKAVMTSDHCDFLTNQGLGVPEEDRTENDITGKVTWLTRWKLSIFIRYIVHGLSIYTCIYV